jgi:hypothetical protein
MILATPIVVMLVVVPLFAQTRIPSPAPEVAKVDCYPVREIAFPNGI